jgi:hypothetical protein
MTMRGWSEIQWGDPGSSSRDLARSYAPDPEQWAERVGEGGNSEELLDVCVGEPKGSKEFRADLEMGAVAAR